MDDAYFADGDEEAQKIQQLTKDYIAQGDHIKALEVIETWTSTLNKEKKKEKILNFFSFRQGKIFFREATRGDSNDVKVAFLLGSVECFSVNGGLSSFCAVSLYGLGCLLGSPMYLKKSIRKAKEYLSLLSFDEFSSEVEKSRREAEKTLDAAKTRLADGSPRDTREPQVKESKKLKIDVEGLRPYWSGLSVEVKRKFMEVSIADFTSYVQRFYGKEGRDALEKVFGSAVSNKKWRLWMCRSCSQEFLTLKKFKIHLEKEHVVKFKPSRAEYMAQMVDEAWGCMVKVEGLWEPVDTSAAAEMIKTRLEFVKVFLYENGWSRDWPLVRDEERSELLKEIRLLLVLFCERKLLSCGLRDWLMHFVVKHLAAQFEVSKDTLTTECGRLVETPQSICFLERSELKQIRDLLKRVKCERKDGRELICRAVDSFYSGARVKEKIDFDKQFPSSLLLDKRLLRCEIAQFDDEGTVSFLNPNDHYAKAHARGDDIVSWLADHSSGGDDERFRFPRPVRTHNLDIWVAVLRAVQFTCRSLGTKYAKKLQMLGYDVGLVDAINLCVSENNKRVSDPEHQCNKKYASLLGDECERRKTEARDSLNTRLFLCSVRDALEDAPHPTFDLEDLEDCLKRIHVHRDLSDDVVLKSIDRLRSIVADKVPLVDTKMLLVENSRISLFNDLIRLSVFDYRSYILRPLKEFLLEVINVAAAEADLLLEEETKPQSKKKKHKKTSTSMSSPIDKTVEHALQGTSSSLQTTEKDSMEPPDNSLSSERDRLEMSSNTVDEEEAAQGFQNMPGEESVLREGAARCKSALDMTLKALLHIKILKEDLMQNVKPFHDDLDKQNPELLHSYILSDLLTSREFISMSSDTAEIVVSILETWHSCKSPERESLVTRLFTLEEYERMSCSRCRQKPYFPEKSSYGIVMAADSIRDLKCAFGDIKFEDILKMIRMEDKMLCDIKTGGCGKANFVHHIISRCPPIFTVVLEWEKLETEKEISETTKALDWEIDMSRLYEGLEPNTKYRLVSMVGCGEDEEHICLAYEKDRWVGVGHGASTEKAVGNWESVIRFYGERKVRPKILFYEAPLIDGLANVSE